MAQLVEQLLLVAENAVELTGAVAVAVAVEDAAEVPSSLPSSLPSRSSSSAVGHAVDNGGVGVVELSTVSQSSVAQFERVGGVVERVAQFERAESAWPSLSATDRV